MRFFQFVILLFYMAVFARGVLDSLPVNAIQNDARASVFSALLPQAWNFFTRNPREPRLLLFRQDPDGSLTPATSGPNFQPQHLFGWRRRPRAERAELEFLAQEAARTEGWVTCETDLQTCAARSDKSAAVENHFLRPNFCGQLVFVSEEPIPWAWASERFATAMPSNILKATVTCSKR